MSARLALLVGAALLCSGCEVSSDIGKPCVLVRKATAEELKANPELGNTRSIKKGELLVGQDFISFGSVECEDLICVRDAQYQSEGEQPADAAKGYCSKACVADPALNSCATISSETEAQVKERMTCRALLLDQQALDDMRRTDPVGYRQTFGDNNSPYFCAGAPPTTSN